MLILTYVLVYLSGIAPVYLALRSLVQARDNAQVQLELWQGRHAELLQAYKTLEIQGVTKIQPVEATYPTDPRPDEDEDKSEEDETMLLNSSG